MKRRLKVNVWGNARAYLGTRCVHDFGTDEQAGQDWVTYGEWISGSPDPASFGQCATFWIEGDKLKWRLGCPEWARVKYAPEKTA